MSFLPLASARNHGGPDQFGVPLHDFSSNSNACGPCPDALAVVQQADATAYPDAGYTRLRRQLANFHDVAPERVLVAGSASEFVFRVTALAAQRGASSVWLPRYSYGDYAQAASAWGLPLASSPDGAQLRWACDPSSPLGQSDAAPDGRADTNALCVLDRAYEPLRLSGVSAWSGGAVQNVWQLWTPNKALGLTGVRAAYVIAPTGQDGTVRQLEALAPSWPVGAHGVAMLQAWVRHDVQAWLAASLPVLREWKAAQLQLCESLGWGCLPSEANFFSAQPALPSGITLAEALVALRTRGIKLRDTTSFGLPGHVRLSVAAPAAQDALRKAWPDIARAAA
ncbi:MAG: aminotransferase class I/II-fold pyridoxal phosphate-dependent enzyme [Polaromonas sp.]|uniref:aminotransferase class I/II-fold pyridoxal phosphate-dependent enzyme n=1 Tax=Polaromonas sp. TaxID=1869339 RepID=UPI0017B5E371|nr:aminotransferase class I/II-fold pyridoxal phosphate-dependent enzyme [Polaromonas sp.]MBA3593625.1 aminotransferase class I/II-fold pyridoxal phosphate-dependent enzyme [Polaromonas sp.]